MSLPPNNSSDSINNTVDTTQTQTPTPPPPQDTLPATCSFMITVLFGLSDMCDAGNLEEAGEASITILCQTIEGNINTARNHQIELYTGSQWDNLSPEDQNNWEILTNPTSSENDQEAAYTALMNSPDPTCRSYAEGIDIQSPYGYPEFNPSAQNQMNKMQNTPENDMSQPENQEEVNEMQSELSTYSSEADSTTQAANNGLQGILTNMQDVVNSSASILTTIPSFTQNLLRR